MAAKNESHDSTATPSTSSPPSRVRDGRKTAHNDSSTATANNPPNHGKNTHGKGAFLLWVGEQRETVDGFDPTLSDLPELYQQWRDGREQADLSGWDR